MSDLYGERIEAEEAYRLIASVGIAQVTVHPAVDEIELSDGSTLRCWEGGYEHGRYWTLTTS